MLRLVTLLSLVATTGVAQAPPRVHVTGVSGPLERRTIVRALVPNQLRECQHTHMGHPLRFTLVIDESGTASLSNVLAHEEIRSYVPCVRSYLARLRFEPSAASTRAHIAIVFQPSGLGLRH